MNESEFKLLRIGDRVREIGTSAAARLRPTYQLTGRMGGDPNGTPFFRRVDLRKPGGVLGRIMRFYPEEIERHEMTMLDQHQQPVRSNFAAQARQRRDGEAAAPMTRRRASKKRRACPEPAEGTP
jgi:hypothetical protein